VTLRASAWQALSVCRATLSGLCRRHAKFRSGRGIIPHRRSAPRADRPMRACPSGARIAKRVFGMRVPPLRSRPPRPRPGERLWSLIKDGRQIDCELRPGAADTWDCQFFDEDWLISGRRCASRTDALKHAAEQRRRLLEQGWTAAS